MAPLGPRPAWGKGTRGGQDPTDKNNKPDIEQKIIFFRQNFINVRNVQYTIGVLVGGGLGRVGSLIISRHIL